MSLSEVFNKLFRLKTAELTAERDALLVKRAENQALIQMLRSENAFLNKANHELNAKLNSIVPIPPEPLPEIKLMDVTGAFVEAAFQDIARLVNGDGMKLFAYGREGMARVPLDAKYRLPATRRDLEAMLVWGFDEDAQYAEDFYDCENYAVYLKGMIDHGFLCNGVGIVIDWTSLPGAHAYNVAMLADGTVLIIEPQDGKVYTLQEKSALYRALTGVMLF